MQEPARRVAAIALHFNRKRWQYFESSAHHQNSRVPLEDCRVLVGRVGPRLGEAGVARLMATRSRQMCWPSLHGNLIMAHHAGREEARDPRPPKSVGAPTRPLPPPPPTQTREGSTRPPLQPPVPPTDLPIAPEPPPPPPHH